MSEYKKKLKEISEKLDKAEELIRKFDEKYGIKEEQKWQEES